MAEWNTFKAAFILAAETLSSSAKDYISPGSALPGRYSCDSLAQSRPFDLFGSPFWHWLLHNFGKGPTSLTYYFWLRWATEVMNLVLKPSSFLVLGPSSSGKTTMLRHAATVALSKWCLKRRRDLRSTGKGASLFARIDGLQRWIALPPVADNLAK